MLRSLNQPHSPMSQRCFQKGPVLVGMIHTGALPGTPASRLGMDELIESAAREAALYREAGADALLVENMHDRPYLRGPDVGPEITAALAVISREIRLRSGLPTGLQILAGANHQSLAAAHAAGLDFIRVEGFVFAHVGDEGLHQSCAGELLRHRRRIGAEGVALWVDIKKKHSSHALTADVSLAETAAAAEFFLADALIVTGTATGQPADPKEVATVVQAAPGKPVLVGSGVTAENASDFVKAGASGLIVGSACKEGGHWTGPVSRDRVLAIAQVVHGFRP